MKFIILSLKTWRESESNVGGFKNEGPAIMKYSNWSNIKSRFFHVSFFEIGLSVSWPTELIIIFNYFSLQLIIGSPPRGKPNKLRVEFQLLFRRALRYWFISGSSFQLYNSKCFSNFSFFGNCIINSQKNIYSAFAPRRTFRRCIVLKDRSK